MNSSLQRVKPVRSRRLKEQRLLQRWEQIRARGKTRFVFETALIWGVTFTGMTDALVHLLTDATHSITLFMGIGSLFGGILLGWSAWSDMESKYKTARMEARVSAAPSGSLPPNNSPSQITAD